MMKNDVALTDPGKTGIFRITSQLRDKKYSVNIILALVAIGIEIYYSICAGACSYLKGTIFGIGLQYIGISYMVVLAILSIMKKDTLLVILISAGVGIEFYLIGFQIWYNTYCPYCLAFAAVIFILFALNCKRRHTFLSNASMALALILFAIFFEGSLAPAYSYSFQNDLLERVFRV